MRAGAPADIARLGAAEAELCVVVRATETPEGALFAEGAAVALRRGLAGGGPRRRREVLRRRLRAAPRRSWRRCGERAGASRTTPRRSGSCRRGSRTTRCSAPTCSSPPGAATRSRELCEERGLASDLEDPLAADALLLRALADWQREQIAERGLEGVMRDIELPLVAVLREMELLGVRLNLERLAEITGARARGDRRRWKRSIFALAGEEFLIASPQQLGEILFEKLGLSRKRRGKTGFSTDARVLQAIRSEHEIVPKIERWRELSTLIKTYLDVLPELVDERSRIHTTFLQAVAQTGRLVEHQPEHAERPDPHPARAARSAAASRPSRAAC